MAVKNTIGLLRCKEKVECCLQDIETTPQNCGLVISKNPDESDRFMSADPCPDYSRPQTEV